MPRKVIKNIYPMQGQLSLLHFEFRQIEPKKVWEGKSVKHKICMIIGRNHLTILIKFPFINFTSNHWASKSLEPTNWWINYQIFFCSMESLSIELIVYFYHCSNLEPKRWRHIWIPRWSRIFNNWKILFMLYYPLARNISINNSKTINIQYWKTRFWLYALAAIENKHSRWCLFFIRRWLSFAFFFTYMKLRNKSTIYINNNGFFFYSCEWNIDSNDSSLFRCAVPYIWDY